MKQTNEYTVKKTGDNYGLYFRGKRVEVFANKSTAEHMKRLHEADVREAERRTRLNTKSL